MDVDAKKMLVSIAAAVASSRAVRALSTTDSGDLLGLIGLERRRSHLFEGLGLLGLGAVVGAGAALMMAPSSGRELRAKLGKEIEKLGEVATEAAREVRAGAPALAARISGAADELSSRSNASHG